ALLGLTELALASGEPAKAVAYGQQASEIFRGIGATLYDALALTLLADAHAALSECDAVKSASARAVASTMKGDAQLSLRVQPHGVLSAGGGVAESAAEATAGPADAARHGTVTVAEQVAAMMAAAASLAARAVISRNISP